MKKEISKMKISFLFLQIIFFMFSCSNDDPERGCYQDMGLKIIETIEEESGIIYAPRATRCPATYVIETEDKKASRPLGLLEPCNLEKEFELDSVRVIYSGYVYERLNDGDQCADKFEITSITFSNP
tara:strand:- start:242 stop:622 length:381 start_codon:yes stop_codon:yes gene_type:complete